MSMFRTPTELDNVLDDKYLTQTHREVCYSLLLKNVFVQSPSLVKIVNEILSKIPEQTLKTITYRELRETWGFPEILKFDGHVWSTKVNLSI